MNIIELAKNAGLKVGTNISGVTLVGSPSTPGLAHISIDEMELFAALVLEEAAKPQPLSDSQSLEIFNDLEKFMDQIEAEEITDEHLAGESLRFILDRVAAIRALKGAKE